METRVGVALMGSYKPAKGMHRDAAGHCLLSTQAWKYVMHSCLQTVATSLKIITNGESRHCEHLSHIPVGLKLQYILLLVMIFFFQSKAVCLCMSVAIVLIFPLDHTSQAVHSWLPASFQAQTYV